MPTYYRNRYPVRTAANVAADMQRAATRRATVAAKLVDWVAANEEEKKWIDDNRDRNNFALSMSCSLAKYGALTEKQLAAVKKIIVDNAARKIERAIAADEVKMHCGEGASEVLASLLRAKAKGIKRPMMRTEGLVFSLAPETGNNPGNIYVKNGQAYIGRIDLMGMFNPSRACTDAQRVMVAYTSEDPLAAAVAYGRMSGQCSCCGRRLDDPKSIELGIGPICKDKYF